MHFTYDTIDKLRCKMLTKRGLGRNTEGKFLTVQRFRRMSLLVARSTLGHDWWVPLDPFYELYPGRHCFKNAE